MTSEQYLQFEPMLLKISNRFKNNKYGLDIDDIMQVGAFGMIRAYETYEDNKGMIFSTYMYNCIEWSIRKEFQIIKNKHKDFTITSLDHEIGEEGVNMYELIPDENIDIENDVIEDMTLKEYIQEFKDILEPLSAEIFIDKYVYGIDNIVLATKYSKDISNITSVLKRSKSTLIKKSWLIREEYRKLLEEKEARIKYNRPDVAITIKDKYESNKAYLNKLDYSQFSSYMNGLNQAIH